VVRGGWLEVLRTALDVVVPDVHTGASVWSEAPVRVVQVPIHDVDAPVELVPRLGN
jgi:hypothetical protein